MGWFRVNRSLRERTLGRVIGGPYVGCMGVIKWVDNHSVHLGWEGGKGATIPVNYVEAVKYLEGTDDDFSPKKATPYQDGFEYTPTGDVLSVGDYIYVLKSEVFTEPYFSDYYEGGFVKYRESSPSHSHIRVEMHDGNTQYISPEHVLSIPHRRVVES